MMKRMLMRLSAACMTAILGIQALPVEPVFAATVAAVLPGDVTGDGTVDAADLDALYQLLDKGVATVFSEETAPAGDVTQDGLIDARDVYAMQQYFAGTAFPTEIPTMANQTVSLALSGATIVHNGTVSLDLSFVDWTKDIISYDVLVRFPREFQLKLADCTGDGRWVVEGNAVKIYGAYADRADWRGKLATLQFETTPDVEGDYCFFVDSAVVSNAAYQFYTVNKPNTVLSVNEPFAPVGLRASGISSQSVALAWEMPFVQETLSGYVVYRDGKEIGQTSECVYLDSKLTTDTSYTYTVKGKTAIGGLTEACTACVVTPTAPVIEKMAFSDTNLVSATQSDLQLTLAESTMISALEVVITDPDGKDIKETLYMDGQTPQTLRYHWNTKGLPSGSYTVTATVVDLDGATATKQITAELDNTPPAPVTLTAHAGGRTAILTWSLALEADAAGYRVYRKDADTAEWTQIAAIDDRTVQDYTDAALTVGTAYTYAISAVDSFGTEGTLSNAETVTPTEDETIPEITLFSADLTGRVAGSIVLSQQAADENGIVGMTCQISADEGKTWETVWEGDGDQAVWTLDTTAYADGVYQLKAIAKDTSGLTSNGTNVLSFAFDNTAPEQVQNLRLDAIYPTQATLAWDDVADEDFSYFLVLLSDGSSTKRYTVKSELGLNLTSLVAKTAYAVTVSAVDQCGNVGQASELFRFVTEPDVTAPVITGMSVNHSVIRPGAELVVAVYASDVSNVSVRYLQYSQNQTDWVTLQLSYRDRSFLIEDSKLQEGPLYLRAYATDQYGNQGDPEQAEIQSILVDTTPPDLVPDFAAVMRDNGISLTWSAPEVETQCSYTLQRAVDDAEGDYQSIFENRTAVHYIDTNVESNHTYYYRIAAYDLAGNMGEFCEPVSVTFAPDTTAPTVKQCYLSADGIVSAAHSTLQVIAADAVCMDTVLLSYQCAGSETWVDLPVGEPTYNSNHTEARCLAMLPAAVLEATAVTVRVIARDAAGNCAEPSDFTFAVDNTKLSIEELTVTRQENQMQIAWDCPDQTGLVYFTVFRTVDDGTEYALQRIYPHTDSTQYLYADTRLTTSGSYQYRVVALHRNGNETSVTADAVAVQSVPNAVLNCFPSQQLGAAYLYDVSASTNADEITSVVLDYGDDTCDTATSVRSAMFSHTYAAVGVYEVTLTCTNADGFSDTATATITVEEPVDLAEVAVTVLTTEGKPAAFASVYVDVGTEEQVKYDTDSEGKVSFVTTSGQHEIGVFGDGYLPVTKTCTFYTGKVNDVSFSIVCNQLVDASFHVTRMTLSEIIAAGIDVDDPGNLQLVRIDIQLQYVSQAKAESLSIIYDQVSGTRYLSDAARENGYDMHSVSTNKKKEIDAVVLMHIPVKAQMLKEFFNVEMIVINNAEEAYSIDNCTANLSLPQGLTLMDTAKGSSPQFVELGSIAGQQNKSVNWIVRGDVEGSYPLSVDFKGTLAVFNEPIEQTFVSDEKIVVSGTSGLETTVNISNTIRKDSLFVELRMKNNSSIPYYHLSMEIGDVLVSALGRVIGEPTVSVYQARLINKEGLLRVVELSNELEELKPGETFSVLYRISDFSEEYAFTLLKALEDTLEATSTGGGQVKVQISSDALYVDTKSIFYGILFDKDHDYLLAVRNKAGLELADTQVTVEKIAADGTRSAYRSGTTDSRGRLIIPRGEKGVTYCITATHDGYLTYTDDAFAFPANAVMVSSWITMVGDLDEDAYSLAAARYYLDGVFQTDLLQGGASIAQKTEKEMDIYVSARGEVETFELWQDGYRIAKETATRNTAGFEGLEADDFSRDQVITVRAYAASGDFVETKLNLTITAPPEDTASDITDCIANQLGDGATVSTPFSCEFFSLDLTFNTPPLKGSDTWVEVTDHSFKVTVNAATEDKNKTSLKEMLFKRTKDWKFGSTIKITVGAGMYFEAKQDEKTGEFSIAGAVFVKCYGEGTATVFEAFPVYVDLTLSASLQVTGELSYKFYPDPAKQSKLVFTLKGDFFVRLGIYLGLGAQGIANAGAYADGGFYLNTTLFRTDGKPSIDKLYLQGHAGIKFELFGFVTKIEFWEGTISIIDNTAGRPPVVIKPDETDLSLASMGRSMHAAMLDTANYRQATAESISEAGAWNGTLSETADTLSTLQENFNGSATPVTATVDGQPVMVWLQKDVARGVNNATHAVYSLYDAGTNTWSAPADVDDNQQAEYSPVLYQGTDGLYLAYQEAKQVYTDDQILSLDTYATDLTLATAKFDPETKTFVPTGAVDGSVNGACTSKPKFYQDADGQLYLFWASNAQGTLFEKSTRNEICYATMGTDGWSAPQALQKGLPTLVDYTVGQDAKGATTVAYVTDPDCDLMDTSDQRLTVCTMAQKTKLLAEGKITQPTFAVLPGQTESTLQWVCNQTLYTSADLSTSTAIMEGAAQGFTGQYALTDHSILMLCRQEDRVAVASAQYDTESKDFTQPVLLYQAENRYYSDLQAVSNGTDTLLTMIATDCTFTEEGMELAPSLVCCKEPTRHQLSATDVTYDLATVVPGAKFPISMDVTNIGTTSVTALQVALLDADGKAVATDTISTLLASGETTTVDAAPVLPADFKNGVYTLAVSEKDQPVAVVEPAEAQTIDLSKTNLVLETSRSYLDDQTLVTILVTNESNVPTAAMLTATLAESGAKTVSFLSETIAPHTSAIWTVDSAELLGDAYHDMVQLSVTAQTPEAQTDDNTDLLSLTKGGYHAFKLGDVDYNGVVNANDATQALVMYTVSLTGAVPYETNYQQQAADTDGDGRVTANDAVLILSYYVANLSGSAADSFEQFLTEYANGGTQE